jgi:tetratricopeptide (TPR) repeat protein
MISAAFQLMYAAPMSQNRLLKDTKQHLFRSSIGRILSDGLHQPILGRNDHVIGDGGSLRHLPFFEEVAAHEEHQAEWRAAAAGLVTLRLVDAWIEGGPEIVAPESMGVTAVLKAIDAMDEGSRLPQMLRGIVHEMQAAAAGNAQAVFTPLLAYGRALEYEAKWLLALDVYDTVVVYAHPIEEHEAASAAHQRRGASFRTISRFDDALAAYATASAVAEAAGDMIGVLQAKTGAANVAIARGDLPRADRAFEVIAQEAAHSGFPDQQAHALDSRAAVAGHRGDHALAIRFAYEALRISSEPAERDRILNNIGTAFHMLGIRSAARDAFLVLSVAAQEQYVRWTAMLSLITLAAEDGSELAFDQLRAGIQAGKLPPEMKVDYFLHLGRAHRALEHEDLAEIAFAKAVELSECYGLNRQLFEAEHELDVTRVPPRSCPTWETEEDIARAAEAVHSLRMHTIPETAK